MPDRMDQSAIDLLAVAAACRRYHQADQGRRYVYLDSFALHLATIHLCLIAVLAVICGGGEGDACCHFKSVVGAVCIAENLFAFVVVTFQLMNLWCVLIITCVCLCICCYS